MKTVCQLDSNAYFLGLTTADEDPLQQGQYLIPAGCVEAEPPLAVAGKQPRWNGEGWEYEEDHRGEIYYDTATGEKVEIKEIGKISENLTALLPLEQPCKWDGSKWVIDEAKLADYLAEQKQTKLAEINSKAQAFVTAQARLNEVPDFEIQTWEQQRVEALAWSDDPAVETPILAAIAEARGIELDKLRAAALRKAQAFSLLSAHIAGQRQALVDRLNQATTVEEVEAIEVGFSKPLSSS